MYVFALLYIFCVFENANILIIVRTFHTYTLLSTNIVLKPTLQLFYVAMVIETVQLYTENGARPVYVLLLDASKAFDKVAFIVLLNELPDRAVCPRIIKLLYVMYTNQSCSVKWDNKQSDYFKISNGIKQGGIISPLLFRCYIDNLFTQLQNSGLGCHVGCSLVTSEYVIAAL